MASTFKLAALFIFFFQLSMVMVTYIEIVPGTYLTSGMTANAWQGATSYNQTMAQTKDIYDQNNANNIPSSTFNLFGMGWVFQVITLMSKTFESCTIGAPAFYTSMFSLIDTNHDEAALFGGIFGTMQAMAFSIGLASIVMRWNI